MDARKGKVTAQATRTESAIAVEASESQAVRSQMVGAIEAVESQLLNTTARVGQVLRLKIDGRTQISVSGRLVFTTPPAKSMTMETAATYFRDQAAKVGQMIDRSVSMEAQAKQALNFLIYLRDGAKAALYDSKGTAREFQNSFPLPTLKKLKAELIAAGKGGNALYEGILNRLSNMTWPRTSFEVCFPAGTQVLTDIEWVPIETVKVGDLVLSKPENGGERAYKRVVKTAVFDDRVIRSISYTDNLKSMEYCSVDATENHPFWVIGKGWRRADEIDADDCLELSTGKRAWVISNVPIYRTDDPDVCWIPYSHYSADDHFPHGTVGYELNVRTKEIRNEVHDELFVEEEDPYFRTRVYNFEVEEFHTYFVGKGLGGVWVHNANCAQLWDETLYGASSALSRSVPQFATKAELRAAIAANDLLARRRT